MATLLPLPFALSPRCPVPLAAYCGESRLLVSLSLEPFLSRSFPLRTVSTMPALTAFFYSRIPALHRAACLSTSLAPAFLPSLPVAAAPRRYCAALPSLPLLSPQPATRLSAVHLSRPLLSTLAP